MSASTFRFGAFAASVAICVPAGCAKSPRHVAPRPPAPPAKPALSRASGSIPALAATVSGTQFSFSDPKTGRLLWVAHARTLTANTAAGAAGAVATLTGVTGVIYHSGKPADKVKAAKVTANEAARTITATGDVQVVSVARQPTTIRCDRLVWSVATDKLLGTGSVVCTKGGFTQVADSFLADTRLRTIVAPAPGQPQTNVAGVRATIVARRLSVPGGSFRNQPVRKGVQ